MSQPLTNSELLTKRTLRELLSDITNEANAPFFEAVADASYADYLTDLRDGLNAYCKYIKGGRCQAQYYTRFQRRKNRLSSAAAL